jgi:hypothetical protein
MVYNCHQEALVAIMVIVIMPGFTLPYCHLYYVLLVRSSLTNK